MRHLPIADEGSFASLQPATSRDLRILSHYPQVRAIRGGQLPPPRNAVIYPVYGCNLDCVGCEYAEDNAQGFEYLDRFAPLLGELATLGVEGVEFCGGGEPLLHPGLVEAVTHGASLGLRFGLLTNGTVIGDRFVASLAHFAYVRITLDAATESVYARVRPSKGPSPWPRLLENIGRLLRARSDSGSTEIAIKFLVNRLNANQIDDAVALARSLGVDGIQFKALRDDPAELRPDEALDVEAMIASARATHAPFPVTGSLAKLTMHRQCELTPLQVTIDARGDVFLCCYFTHRRENHRIGNVHERPLAEIWASERHRAAIRGILPGECSKFDCRFVRYHDVLDEWVGAHGDGLKFL